MPRSVSVSRELQRLCQVWPGRPIIRSAEMLSKSSFWASLIGGNGLGGGVNPADALEFIIGEGLDAEGEAVEAEVFGRLEKGLSGGFGVGFEGGFGQL